jgi:integrase
MFPWRFPDRERTPEVKFTREIIDGLVIPAGKKEFIEFDETGLGIRLRGKNRRFIIQYRVAGGARQRRETLGDPRKMKVEDVRRIAQRRLAQVKLGHDPAAERRRAEAKARLTLGHVADTLYLPHKQAKSRPGTYKQIALHLREHWRPLRKQPLHEITRADIAAQLQILIRERGERAAARARTNLSGFFSWAVREGLCDHNVVAATNDPEKGAKPRERALDDSELAIVWRACGGDDIGRISRLLILTGARRGEIGQLVRSEVVGDVMTIPGERTKPKRPLVQTLPVPALEILQSIPQQEGRDFYFGVRGRGYSCWSTGKKQLDAKIVAATGTPLAPWRWHDLRRTMRSGLGRLGVRPDVAERCVGHVRGKIERTYDTHSYAPEIARALALWADRVLALVEGRDRKVVPLRA